MVALLGHADVLLVADSKASALATHATLAGGGERYFFPLPLTGEVPDLLRTWVLTPPVTPAPVVQPPTHDDPTRPRNVDTGFEVTRDLDGPGSAQQPVQWRERWLVVQSTAWAQRQPAALTTRVERAETDLARLRAKKGERTEAVQAWVDTVLQRPDVAAYLQVTVTETATVTRRSRRKGRPSATTPVAEVTTYQPQVAVRRNDTALADAHRLAGWRIYVTNSLAEALLLGDAMAPYRDEWADEHGYHRWKRGAIPALPLFLHLEWRIRGLMLLLLIALQVLTLLEWQARRTLAAEQETLADLVPGNPKMATARPTAERLLRVFTNVHLLIHQVGDQRVGQVREALSPLQQRILHLLHLLATCYGFQAQLSSASFGAEG